MRTKRIITIPAVLTLLIGIQVSCSPSSGNSNVANQESRKNENAVSNIPSVGFCEVLGNPAYLSKVIKINGNLGRFQNYITFYDERCVPPHPMLNVEFPANFSSDVDNETGAKLDQIVHGSAEAREGKIHVIVSVIGLYEKIPDGAGGGEMQYRFIVRGVEANK
jgi:hypothetical protein